MKFFSYLYEILRAKKLFSRFSLERTFHSYHDGLFIDFPSCHAYNFLPTHTHCHHVVCSMFFVCVSRMKNNTKIALFNSIKKFLPCSYLPLFPHESKIYDQHRKKKIPYAFFPHTQTQLSST